MSFLVIKEKTIDILFFLFVYDVIMELTND